MENETAKEALLKVCHAVLFGSKEESHRLAAHYNIKLMEECLAESTDEEFITALQGISAKLLGDFE